MPIFFHDTCLRCPKCTQTLLYERVIGAYSQDNSKDPKGYYLDPKTVHEQLVCSSCGTIVKNMPASSEEHIGKMR